MKMRISLIVNLKMFNIIFYLYLYRNNKKKIAVFNKFHLVGTNKKSFFNFTNNFLTCKRKICELGGGPEKL